MSDIQPTEAEREEAERLCMAMWHASITGIFDPTIKKFVDVAAIEISRIRADAVKAERERVATRANRWVEYNRNPDTTLPFDGEDLELYLLSDDQEARNG